MAGRLAGSDADLLRRQGCARRRWRSRRCGRGYRHSHCPRRPLSARVHWRSGPCSFILAGTAVGILAGAGLGAVMGDQFSAWRTDYRRGSEPTSSPRQRVRLAVRVSNKPALVLSRLIIRAPKLVEGGVEGQLIDSNSPDSVMVNVPWTEIGAIQLP